MAQSRRRGAVGWTASPRRAQSVTFNATPLMAAAMIYFALLWPFVRLLSRLEKKPWAGRA